MRSRPFLFVMSGTKTENSKFCEWVSTLNFERTPHKSNEKWPSVHGLKLCINVVYDVLRKKNLYGHE